jgi:hypothetical protein
MNSCRTLSKAYLLNHTNLSSYYLVSLSLEEYQQLSEMSGESRRIFTEV